MLTDRTMLHGQRPRSDSTASNNNLQQTLKSLSQNIVAEEAVLPSKPHLLSSFPSATSKPFIVTTSTLTTLSTLSTLAFQAASLLSSTHHAITFAAIIQHAPLTLLDRATDTCPQDL
ncbi:MAG: hypothetical protein LQ343_003763 [Gyalolechia ehrenbergii]|nr:MAG: hypothetical protein LQ343_003763 [Gyalolechia ehrenbergii]